MPEQEILEPRQVMERFPFLNEWWIGNDLAHVKGEKRLLTVKERLESAGGVEQIKIDLQTLPERWRDKYLMLLACQQDPTDGHSISLFVEQIKRRRFLIPSGIPFGSLYQFESGRGPRYLLREDFIRISRDHERGQVVYTVTWDAPGYIALPNSIPNFRQNI